MSVMAPKLYRMVLRPKYQVDGPRLEVEVAARLKASAERVARQQHPDHVIISTARVLESTDDPHRARD